MACPLLGGAVDVLIGLYGLSHTFFILAVAVAPVMILGLFFIKMPDSGYRTSEDTEGKSDRIRKEYSAAQMIRTASFWIFSAGAL